MSGVDVAGAIVVIIIVFLTLLTIGHTDGRRDEEKKWKKDMIDRGLAQYNAKTGEWEWIEK